MDSRKGRANRDVVSKLIDDMGSFCDYVKEELKAMQSKTEDLHGAWNDPQYEQFSAFMHELIEALGGDLGIFEEARDGLKAKLALYD